MPQQQERDIHTAIFSRIIVS